MTIVGVKDLKNNLSRYLRRVRAGEEIVVSDRGVPIAELLPLGRARDGERGRLMALAAEGAVSLPSPGAAVEDHEPLSIEGAPLSEAILESRR